MSEPSLWSRFRSFFLRYEDPGISIDISRMRFSDDFFGAMEPRFKSAFAAMKALEAGGIDERRRRFV